ncbi:SLC13 family permease [Chromohalobacter sp. 48-RD10]|uniref:SLC13 family permease n=1 Tax=Chromohalobacter sp. 48-RD10 TaxID=2994063 RepID=UPI002468288B|nr:SLC13 family permease [Chromohalobacter sp. 48-RD10]
MPFDAWLTLAIVAASFLLMATSRLGPDVILMGAVIALFGAGVINADEALAGFSNTGLFTVAFMYILVASIRETGGIDLLIRYVLGRPRHELGAQARLLLPVSATSAFLNNTPVVATFLPAVLSWSRRLRLPAHRLLMPLSFASILGGTCSLLGTSTNLVVDGLLRDRYPEQALHLFDIAWIGVPVALVGLAYLMLVGRWLLPKRRTATDVFENPREYTIEMQVDPQGPIVDKSVEEAGLRHLDGLFLVEIEREGNIVSVVGRGERLKANDRLVFAGTTEAAVELQQIRGLRPTGQGQSSLKKSFAERRLVEAVVSEQCQFLGRRLREGHFRTFYGASVLAVCRHGERVSGNLGQIQLQPADVLLMEVRPAFIERHRQSRDFLLISELNGQARPHHERAWVAWSIMLGVVALAAFGVLSLLKAAMLGAALALMTGCCTISAARRGLDTQVLLTIAASFGVGAAMESSGAASTLAQGALTLADGNPYLLLIGAYLVVALLTEIVTNNAAAVISFPIVTGAAQQLGVDIMPFVIVVMFAASASFLTPIGYQTNLMVYGPGGYRFSDYLRVGGGLSVLVGVMTLVLTPLIWPF